MATQTLVQGQVEMRGAAGAAALGWGAGIRSCDACGMVVLVAAGDRRQAQGWGGILLCNGCTRALPAAEVERLACEWALRGVPLS